MPSATTSTLPLSPAELSYLHTSLSTTPPIRPDGRTPTDFRALQAETNILPATNGSAHVSFSDGSEAIVGVKLEVERTTILPQPRPAQNGNGSDQMDIDIDSLPQPKGQADWITLTLTTPNTRDDDASLIYLEQLLREPLLPSSTSSNTTPSLADALIINSRYHYHIAIDIILISPHPLSSLPLPLLSIATHLALRDTRVPRLKSEGEEDPVADDDWMASTYLYPREDKAHDVEGKPNLSEGLAGQEAGAGSSGTRAALNKPPVTLLITTVANNILFDPSFAEVRVADFVVAVSIAPTPSSSAEKENVEQGYIMTSLRTIDTPARDSMKGIPKSTNAAVAVSTSGLTNGAKAAQGASGLKTPDASASLDTTAMSGTGVWTPRQGGIKRTLLKSIVSTVLNDVAPEVFMGLDGFVRVEAGS